MKEKITSELVENKINHVKRTASGCLPRRMCLPSRMWANCLKGSFEFENCSEMWYLLLNPLLTSLFCLSSLLTNTSEWKHCWRSMQLCMWLHYCSNSCDNRKRGESYSWRCVFERKRERRRERESTRIYTRKLAYRYCRLIKVPGNATVVMEDSKLWLRSLCMHARHTWWGRKSS